MPVDRNLKRNLVKIFEQYRICKYLSANSPEQADSF